MDVAFEERTEPLRRELLAHCYQMLGSVYDAEDLVQETLLRAWRSREQYDDTRASLRTWLHRIATNACLTALAGRARRPLPSALSGPYGEPEQALVPGLDVPWLQPMPDGLLDDSLAGRASMRLAFVAALQVLPARQRAVLILRDVLDYSAEEVAATLETTVAAVNSRLQRARATLAAANLDTEEITEPSTAEGRAAVDRYVEAFERADIASLTKLLTDDVLIEMPPVLNWYVGREAYGRFIAHLYSFRGTDWRMLPISANGQPAVAAYVRRADARRHLHTVQIFTVGREGISRNTVFQDAAVMASFRVSSTVD